MSPSTLSKVIHELTSTHARDHGEEPGLLHLLERAVASSSGRGSAAGAARTGSPVDLSAMALWQEIEDVVGEHWPGHGDLMLAPMHLSNRLVLWATNLSGTENEAHLLEMVLYWRRRIYDLLEPPVRVPLRGVTCPHCLQSSYRHPAPADGAEAGGYVHSPVLLVHLSETPPRAECLHCGSDWLGGELEDLGAAQALYETATQ